MKNQEKKLNAFRRILEVLERLREECPWDRKQTMESLNQLTIEEVYELSDAIADNDPQEVKKELGDVMLHLVFYSKIAEEKGLFDIADVIDTECEKLIFRHPHIYGDVKADSQEQVKQNWEKLKLREGNKSVLGGVPRSLPALVKAYRIQEKVQGVGFDWDEPGPVWEKVEEEIREFKAEEKKADREKMEREFGDVLFSLINYARKVGIHPENALEKTNRKFIRRFTRMEDFIREQGKNLSEMTLEEMDVFWEKAKKEQREEDRSGALS